MKTQRTLCTLLLALSGMGIHCGETPSISASNCDLGETKEVPCGFMEQGMYTATCIDGGFFGRVFYQTSDCSKQNYVTTTTDDVCPAIDENTLVFVASDAQTLKRYDLRTGNLETLTTVALDEGIGKIALHDNMLAYTLLKRGEGYDIVEGIRMYDIERSVSTVVERVEEGFAFPFYGEVLGVNDSFLLASANARSAEGEPNPDLFLYNLQTQTLENITRSSASELQASIDDTNVVYVADDKLSIYNLDDKQHTPLDLSSVRNINAPVIYDDFIAFSGTVNNDCQRNCGEATQNAYLYGGTTGDLINLSLPRGDFISSVVGLNDTWVAYVGGEQRPSVDTPWEANVYAYNMQTNVTHWFRMPPTENGDVRYVNRRCVPSLSDNILAIGTFSQRRENFREIVDHEILIYDLSQ